MTMRADMEMASISQLAWRALPSPVTYAYPLSGRSGESWVCAMCLKGVSVVAEIAFAIKQFGDTPYAPIARARLEELRKKKTAIAEQPPNPIGPTDRGSRSRVIGAHSMAGGESSTLATSTAQRRGTWLENGRSSAVP